MQPISAVTRALKCTLDTLLLYLVWAVSLSVQRESERSNLTSCSVALSSVNQTYFDVVNYSSFWLFATITHVSGTMICLAVNWLTFAKSSKNFAWWWNQCTWHVGRCFDYAQYKFVIKYRYPCLVLGKTKSRWFPIAFLYLAKETLMDWLHFEKWWIFAWNHGRQNER